MKRISLLLALLILFLVGCAPVATEPSTLVEAPEGPTAAPEEEGPVSEGTLFVGRQEDTESLDPHDTTTISSIEVMYQIYDTLVVLDYDMSIKPGLAESWDISEDGTVYTFKLREGVTFHSGDELTAEDVVFTFERWKANEASPTHYLIAPLQEVKALDDLTVQFTLEKPFVIFLNNLTEGYASILNQDFVEQAGDDYGVRVVDGTGPYKLSKWTRGEELVVEKYEDYAWGPAIFENQGAPYLDKIVWQIIPEPSTRIASLKAGDIHFTTTVPPIRVSNLKESEGINTVEFSQLNTTFMGMATDKSPLDDPNVRRAINHAIDKEALAEGAYYGLAEPAWGPIAPATWGYWSGVKDIGYGYDPDKAVQLLEEAGWDKINDDGIRVKDGQPLKLKFLWSSGAESETIVPILQNQLKEVGIDTELQKLEWTAYLDALANHEHELMWMWVRYTSADILYFYFHSSQQPAPNRFAWDDSRTNELLEVSRTSSDDQERLEAYRGLQEIVVENAIWVPLLHTKRVVAGTDSLKGVQIHPANILYKSVDLWLESK